MGKIATTVLGQGNGWSVCDVVCTAGPQDRPAEEQHDWISVAVVVEGSFRFRNQHGSVVMSPGSVMLKNHSECFECSHDHGTGDRCLSFRYAPDFFENAGLCQTFRMNRVPAIRAFSPWVVASQSVLHSPGKVVLAELAHGIANAAMGMAGIQPKADCMPTAADERRISTVLRFIESNFSEPLSLECLASIAKMSEFHFLRVFRRVTHTSPHQYIRRTRLRHAAVRLLIRPVDVSETAFNAGFCDLSNFNHAFRSEFGMTPTQFRDSRTAGFRSPTQ